MPCAAGMTADSVRDECPSASVDVIWMVDRVAVQKHAASLRLYSYTLGHDRRPRTQSLDPER